MKIPQDKNRRLTDGRNLPERYHRILRPLLPFNRGMKSSTIPDKSLNHGPIVNLFAERASDSRHLCQHTIFLITYNIKQRIAGTDKGFEGIRLETTTLVGA
jgi:hypothetical protein